MSVYVYACRCVCVPVCMCRCVCVCACVCACVCTCVYTILMICVHIEHLQCRTCYTIASYECKKSISVNYRCMVMIEKNTQRKCCSLKPLTQHCNNTKVIVISKWLVNVDQYEIELHRFCSIHFWIVTVLVPWSWLPLHLQHIVLEQLKPTVKNEWSQFMQINWELQLGFKMQFTFVYMCRAYLLRLCVCMYTCVCECVCVCVCIHMCTW